jgi:hypothetical protein
VPRQTIRENAKLICLFPEDMKTVGNIYNDHVSTDMHKQEFKNLCRNAWEQHHGFGVIDLTSNKMNDKCGSGFDTFDIAQMLSQLE